MLLMDYTPVLDCGVCMCKHSDDVADVLDTGSRLRRLYVLAMMLLMYYTLKIYHRVPLRVEKNVNDPLPSKICKVQIQYACNICLASLNRYFCKYVIEGEGRGIRKFSVACKNTK